jgi:hypothetical protein
MNRTDLLTDQLIQAAFERRAGRADPVGLRDDILALTATSNQPAAWRLRLASAISVPKLAIHPPAERVTGGPGRRRPATRVPASRPAYAWLLVLGLLAAAMIGVLTVGGSRVTAPPPSVSPSPSTELSADASAPASTAACPAIPTATKVQLTPIDLPDYAVDVVFADCSAWAQSESNGGGIARIDPVTGTVVTTIVPDEVVLSMTAHDGAVYAVATPARSEPGDPPHLVRIDSATNLVADVVALSTGGDLAILGDTAWVRNTRTGATSRVPLDGGASSEDVAAFGPFVGTAFGSVWTDPGQTGRLGRFDATGRLTSIDVGDVVRCAIAETGIACAGGSGHVVFVSPDTDTVTWSTDLPGWAAEVVSIAARSGSIWIQPAELPPGRFDSTPLIELDERTGEEIRRFVLPIRQPVGLWAVGGSLWASSVETPLMRVDVPAP